MKSTALPHWIAASVLFMCASGTVYANPNDLMQDILVNPIELESDTPYHMRRHEPIAGFICTVAVTVRASYAVALVCSVFGLATLATMRPGQYE